MVFISHNDGPSVKLCWKAIVKYYLVIVSPCFIFFLFRSFLLNLLQLYITNTKWKKSNIFLWFVSPYHTQALLSPYLSLTRQHHYQSVIAFVIQNNMKHEKELDLDGSSNLRKKIRTKIDALLENMNEVVLRAAIEDE